ncbi:MAG: hypothetical protein RR547_03785 [Raoultibacter sp.]
MVTVMVTVNWNLHAPDHSPLQFALSFYEYPVMFCIALAVRFLVADPVVGIIIGKVIVKHLNGLAKSVAITLANVLFMATIMGVFGLLVTGGLGGFTWERYMTMLPQTYCLAFFFSFFIVGPLVKMLYHSFVHPALEAFRAAPQDKRVSVAFATLVRSKTLADEGQGGGEA